MGGAGSLECSPTSTRRRRSATASRRSPSRAARAGSSASPPCYSVWKSTSASGAPDNSSLSHFSATTRPCWLRRGVRDPHRHAIEQASRRWRGGRRDDSAQRRREILISTQVLLHTTDSGKSWERIPLSPKLPRCRPRGRHGARLVKGRDDENATGAIYTTTNAGRNWKAEVKESIDATPQPCQFVGRLRGFTTREVSETSSAPPTDGIRVCSIARQLLPDLEARGRLLAPAQPRHAPTHHGHGLRRQQRAKWSLDDDERAAKWPLLELLPIPM